VEVTATEAKEALVAEVDMKRQHNSTMIECSVLIVAANLLN